MLGSVLILCRNAVLTRPALLSLPPLLPLQYDVPESALLGHTLWLSVWDWDRFGRNQFLGEVRVALKEFDLSTCTERWYPLKEKVGRGDYTRHCSHRPFNMVRSCNTRLWEVIQYGEVIRTKQEFQQIIAVE